MSERSAEAGPVGLVYRAPNPSRYSIKPNLEIET